jgi:two-component system, cell cycle sensor histidine kinase and response regulator CckA
VPTKPPLSRRDVYAYVLAVASSLAAIAITRFTWPAFESTPLVPLFSAVALTTHFGSGPAGLLALALSIAGSFVAFPNGGPPPLDVRALLVFVAVGLLANRVLAGRKSFETSLRRSEAEFRAVWEHAALGAALLDLDGRIERINPALERMFGASGTAAAGTPFAGFNHPDEGDFERARLAELMKSGVAYQRDQQYRRLDGTLFWGRVTMSAIRPRGGPATGALAILEDITDLRASEEKFRQAQKMEAVGQLVAGVAHNFNNLLTVTMGYTDLLLERHHADPAGAADLEELEEIQKATQRGAALTHQLLAFGRKHIALPTRIDLNRVVTGLREMLRRLIREDIALRIEAAPEPAMVRFDPHDLEQVILNLVINARDALPMVGAIDVDVSLQTLTTESGMDVAPGDYVRLRVHDNGTGMTPDIVAHLFEPFFTTKDVGAGTGLGLAFVDGVVRHGGGSIAVDTAPHQGTTFSIYLPRVRDLVPDKGGDPSRRPAADLHSGGTILLVEDESSVREMTERLLGRAGYRVLSAGTPGEAVELFAVHADAIDLLLTDVVMPEMHGPALAQQLISRRPDLRVLFVSGHSDSLPSGVTATGRMAFLGKPFAPAHLLAKISDMLAAV